VILIIDDDGGVSIGNYIESLERAGYGVTQAFDPDEALAVLQEQANAIELIVLDVSMPTGIALESEDTNEGLHTGEVLLVKLKELYPAIPVIVLTITNFIAARSEGYTVLVKQDTLPNELLFHVTQTLKPSA
jgi:CheY-like chemotaxis protein